MNHEICPECPLRNVCKASWGSYTMEPEIQGNMATFINTEHYPQAIVIAPLSNRTLEIIDSCKGGAEIHSKSQVAKIARLIGIKLTQKICPLLNRDPTKIPGAQVYSEHGRLTDFEEQEFTEGLG